jgi:hypothetical protein
MHVEQINSLLTLYTQGINEQLAALAGRESRNFNKDLLGLDLSSQLRVVEAQINEETKKLRKWNSSINEFKSRVVKDEVITFKKNFGQLLDTPRKQADLARGAGMDPSDIESFFRDERGNSVTRSLHDITLETITQLSHITTNLIQIMMKRRKVLVDFLTSFEAVTYPNFPVDHPIPLKTLETPFEQSGLATPHMDTAEIRQKFEDLLHLIDDKIGQILKIERMELGDGQRAA